MSLVAIVHFRDGKVAHEHIYWDQASVLVQIGKLDPAGLPVAGAETARKVLDKDLPSTAACPTTCAWSGDGGDEAVPRLTARRGIAHQSCWSCAAQISLRAPQGPVA